MIRIQVLLLPAERREGGSRGVVMPGLVPLLGVSRATPLSVIILPDGEPCFQERTGYLERRPNRTSQQLSERVLFFTSQMPRPVQEQRAVKPQVFAHSADLVPIAPGRRRWLEGQRQSNGSDQLGDRCRIGRRELEPPADGTVIDADCSADCTRGLDLRTQGMHLGDPCCPSSLAPAIAFRRGVMLIRRRRLVTESTLQARRCARRGYGDGLTHLLDDLVDRLDHVAGGVEQAQLMRSDGPDFGQDARIQTGIVRDDLVRVDTDRL